MPYRDYKNKHKFAQRRHVALKKVKQKNALIRAIYDDEIAYKTLIARHLNAIK